MAGNLDGAIAAGGAMEADGLTIDLPRHIRAFLAEQQRLTLATASLTGMPHAITLAYVNDGATLYLWLQRESTTGSHVEQNPRIAFTIARAMADPRGALSVQGNGECRALLHIAERARVAMLFEEKFGASAAMHMSACACYHIALSALAVVAGVDAASGEDAHSPGTVYRRDLTNSVFRSLPERDVVAVTGQLDLAQIGAGEVIVRQGAPANTFFIIAEGEVVVLREDNGEEHTVATLTRGQFFGEMALLRDLPRTATVRATVPTTLLTMDRDAFRAIVSHSLATTQDFDRLIQQRLGEPGPDSGG